MKQTKLNNDMQEKARKLVSIVLKLWAAFFVVIGIIIIVAIYQYETKEKREEQEEIIATEQEKKTEQTKTQEETAKKGISDIETAYVVNAFPYMKAILEDNAKLVKLVNSGSNEDTKEERIRLAQKIIENGKILEGLKSEENIKIICDLVQMYGYSMKDANENYLITVENNDKEYIELWILSLQDAISYYNEFSFYVENGVTIDTQLKEDIKKATDEYTYVNAGLIASGNPNVIVQLKADNISDKKAMRNGVLMSIYNILETLSKNKAYQYLNVTITVYSDVTDEFGQEKNLKIMQMEMKAETRGKINFENSSWINIPNIADSYQDKL